MAGIAEKGEPPITPDTPDEPQKHHLEGKEPDVYTPRPEDINL